MNRKEAENPTSILIRHFQELMPLNESERIMVQELFKSRHYRKKQVVLQEGSVCQQLSFVISGCLRLYKIDGQGSIHVVQFASELSWMTDLGSFHGRTAAELNIDALEDTVLLQISYDNLLHLYTHAPKFDRIFRVYVENSLVALQSRLLQYISSSAEDRYRSFLQDYPNLVNRIPQTQVAAYLGITPEFLSRLRRSMLHHRKS